MWIWSSEGTLCGSSLSVVKQTLLPSPSPKSPRTAFEHRCGALRMLLCSLVLLCLQVLCYAAPAHDPNDKCTVVGTQEFKTSLNTKTLAFITPEQSLDIILLFRDLDSVYYRDALVVSNYAATHYMVRKGSSSNTSHPLSLVIPEGWNRLRLLANDRTLSLEWITGNDQVTLLSLTLDFTADKVCLKGSFSVCSGVSPEWNVGDGQRVTILLQPLKSEQELVVSGQDNTKPYLLRSSERLPISTNTTLKVKTHQRSSDSVIDIVQENKEGEPLEINQPLRPVMVVGGDGGNTYLRLNLSDPHKEEEDSLIQLSFIIAIVLAGLLVTFITATITLAYLLRMEKKKPNSHREQKKPHPSREEVNEKLISGNHFQRLV